MAAMLSSACRAAGRTVIPIATARQQITANPPPTPPDPVILEGTIEKQLPLLNGTVYNLKDKTSSLWIRSTQPDAVAVGDRLRVRVELQYQAIPVGDRDWGEPYGIERDRLEHQTAP